MSFNSQKKSKKPLLFALGGGVLLALIAAGAVFGFVLPNQPGNVWSTGLNRSGKALTALVNSATDSKNISNFKKSDITATLSGTSEGVTFSGALGTKFDETGANGKLTVKASIAGQPEQNYDLDFIAQITKGQTYPKAFLKLSGFKALNLDAFLPKVSNYDGKWIEISQDYFKSLGLDQAISTAKTPDITAADITELSKAVTSVTQKHVFTADPKVAVFERRKTLGKEKVDGIDAFHYVVGLNKANSVTYCKALVDSVVTTNAFKKYSTIDTSAPATKESGEKDCENGFKDLKTTDTFDMWIDAKYKLVYKVRLTDTSNTKTYVDIGQKYTGGDDVSLFAHSYDDTEKGDINFTLKTNMKTNITSAILAFDGSKSTSNPFTLNLSLTAKPFTGTVDTTSPAGAIKIEDVLKQLGIDPNALLGN